MIKTAANNKITIGKYGERVALKYLQDKGFSILANNIRLSEENIRGEMDILCVKDNIIQIVEVKTCVLPDLPEMNLSKVKIAKLRKLRLVLLSKLASGDFSTNNKASSPSLSPLPLEGPFWTEIRIMGIAVSVTWNNSQKEGDTDARVEADGERLHARPISSLKVRVFPDL